MSATPAVEAVQHAIRDAAHRDQAVRVAGGGSKSALAPAAADPARLSVAELRGVVEYEPAEYTVTVRAGTPVREVAELLAAEGQHLPFDPPLAAAGATLGGTVAAGLSGPGRFRYGGVRDFLLGIRFVDGRGDLHVGGGKVVKNAAGFDLPKLMVGALGRFGVLTELTFKVFPTPEAHATMRAACPSLADAAELMQQLGRSPLELIALELEPPARLTLRVGGIAGALAGRVARLRSVVGDGGATVEDVAYDDADAAVWRDARDFAWVPAGHALVKIPATPPRVAELEHAFQRAADRARTTLPRRYSVGGSVAWLAWPEALPAGELRALLQGVGLPGLVVRGDAFGFGREDPRIGSRQGGAFARRIASVLDPHALFDPERGVDRESDHAPGRRDSAA